VADAESETSSSGAEASSDGDDSDARTLPSSRRPSGRAMLPSRARGWGARRRREDGPPGEARAARRQREERAEAARAVADAESETSSSGDCSSDDCSCARGDCSSDDCSCARWLDDLDAQIAAEEEAASEVARRAKAARREARAARRRREEASEAARRARSQEESAPRRRPRGRKRSRRRGGGRGVARGVGAAAEAAGSQEESAPRRRPRGRKSRREERAEAARAAADAGSGTSSSDDSSDARCSRWVEEVVARRRREAPLREARQAKAEAAAAAAEAAQAADAWATEERFRAAQRRIGGCYCLASGIAFTCEGPPGGGGAFSRCYAPRGRPDGCSASVRGVWSQQPRPWYEPKSVGALRAYRSGVAEAVRFGDPFWGLIGAELALPRAEAAVEKREAALKVLEGECKMAAAQGRRERRGMRRALEARGVAGAADVEDVTDLEDFAPDRAEAVERAYELLEERRRAVREARRALEAATQRATQARDDMVVASAKAAERFGWSGAPGEMPSWARMARRAGMALARALDSPAGSLFGIGGPQAAKRERRHRRQRERRRRRRRDAQERSDAVDDLVERQLLEGKGMLEIDALIVRRWGPAWGFPGPGQSWLLEVRAAVATAVADAAAAAKEEEEAGELEPAAEPDPVDGGSAKQERHRRRRALRRARRRARRMAPKKKAIVLRAGARPFRPAPGAEQVARKAPEFVFGSFDGDARAVVRAALAAVDDGRALRAEATVFAPRGSGAGANPVDGDGAVAGGAVARPAAATAGPRDWFAVVAAIEADERADERALSPLPQRRRRRGRRRVLGAAGPARRAVSGRVKGGTAVAFAPLVRAVPAEAGGVERWVALQRRGFRWGLVRRLFAAEKAVLVGDRPDLARCRRHRRGRRTGWPPPAVEQRAAVIARGAYFSDAEVRAVEAALAAADRAKCGYLQRGAFVKALGKLDVAVADAHLAPFLERYGPTDGGGRVKYRGFAGDLGAAAKTARGRPGLRAAAKLFKPVKFGPAGDAPAAGGDGPEPHGRAAARARSATFRARREAALRARSATGAGRQQRDFVFGSFGWDVAAAARAWAGSAFCAARAAGAAATTRLAACEAAYAELQALAPGLRDGCPWCEADLAPGKAPEGSALLAEPRRQAETGAAGTPRADEARPDLASNPFALLAELDDADARDGDDGGGGGGDAGDPLRGHPESAGRGGNDAAPLCGGGAPHLCRAEPFYEASATREGFDEAFAAPSA
jgi:hypothetical protein